MEPVIRQKIRITGVVQGVGFRPCVYALAVRYGLAGFVTNHSTGVWIEAEAPPRSLDDFLCALRQNPPPPARMETVETAEMPALGETGFAIHHSHAIAGENTPVPPDIATCPDCLAEHAMPEDSRILAVTFDGTGLGTDDAIWGSEILEAGYASFRRLAHLKYVPLPGGDTSVRKPYRMALAHLHAANLPWAG